MGYEADINKTIIEGTRGTYQENTYYTDMSHIPTTKIVNGHFQHNVPESLSP
jgi:hypothetical protein